jgi:hypothetical protein
VVAAERLLGEAAVVYDDPDDLVRRLHDRSGLAAAARASLAGRDRFTVRRARRPARRRARARGRTGGARTARTRG